MDRRLQMRLERASKVQDLYHPNETVEESIANTRFVGIIGPAAIGKSSLIDHLTRTDERFGKVWSFATRDPRPDDTPDVMRTIEPNEDNLEQLVGQIEHGDVVNYAVHPTTLQVYGTFPESYPSTEYALVPTLSSAVRQFDHIPFKSHHYIGIVSDTLSFDRFLRSRNMKPEEKLKRLAEAATSLDWMLAQDPDDITLIVNEFKHGNRAAADMISAITDPSYVQRADAERLAERLYGRITHMHEEGERWMSA